MRVKLSIKVDSRTKSETGDFPGGPVVETLCFHCRGRGFDPWLGN